MSTLTKIHQEAKEISKIIGSIIVNTKRNMK